jgi:endonuclease G
MKRLSLLMLGATLGLGASLAGPAVAQDAAFTPDRANDPETCKELWEGIGLPEYARDDDRDNVIVCHTKYVLSHNNETKTPDWVLERLTRDQISGKNKRPKMKFQPEPNVPQDKRAVDADYRNSKFDRGHQAPSADFSGDADWMVESFFLSNIVPQVGAGFNRGIWKELEDNVRDLVPNRGVLFVITGPINPDEDNRKITIAAKANPCGKAIVLDPPKKEAICGAKASCEAGVTVPTALFKIIYDPGMKRANAFILPNINHRDAGDFKDSVDYLRKFQTTIQVVEKYTGLEFFRGLSKRDRRPQLEQCAAMMLH